MEIGTVETPVKDSTIRRRRTGLSGGSGPNGNSGRGGNSGDDDSKDRASSEYFVPNKARVFTWFLLVVVVMTFGGLSAAYVVTATNRAVEWHPFDLPVQVWISTTIILISSFVYHRGKVALDDFDQTSAKRWLTATAALGAAFISSQLLAWLQLSERGLYFAGNPYAGFFYILTAVHALHVLGGIIALGSVVIGSWNGIYSDERWERLQTLGEVVGWYWHFMGCVWVVLFVLLGFWK
jgi:cytochrome c oxidase subunit III